MNNQRSIYEIFDLFKEARNKQERIEVLRKYDNYALRQVLLGVFTPQNITKLTRNLERKDVKET